ncbi:MAG: alpha-2-macroglobulin family protein, partial [Acidobacteriota bacterium]
LAPFAPGLLFLFLLAAAVPTRASRAVSFNISTNQTFSPDEKPTIHLYAHDVDELEFRIYRVNDPDKFLTNLPDLHSFGNAWPNGPKEQIDERTWLEKFHDWKHHLWYRIRHFFREQFSQQTRDAFREKQSSLAKRSRIVGVAQFAQIPLLNDRQLVARWRQEMPPTYISDSQDLPIDKLPAGLYLVEATDGQYKAYTVLMVSHMVLITRTTTGSILAFAVDRQSGAPIPNAQIVWGLGRKEQGRATTDADGVAELHGAPQKGAEEDSLWITASTGSEFAAVTPMAWSFNNSSAGKWAAYVYTDRPVYRPGHTVYWKALLRARVENHLELPKIPAIHVRIADEQDHPIFDQQLPVSADGAVSGDIAIPANAALGYYTIRLGDNDSEISGSFHVEEYRKPEYQVRVSAQSPRVLQGQSNQVTIDSRYFFGEPVAYGKVKYRIYHQPHYWWGDEDDQASDMGADNDNSGDNQMYDASEEAEQTGKLDASGKLTVTVPTQVDNSTRHTDQDYYIEAGVTDEANREITGRGHFLATYGSFRIHVEPDSYSVRAGSTASFTVTALDYDNKPIQTQIHLSLTWRRWENGKTITTNGPATDVTTDARGTAHATLPVAQSGSAEVLASANTPENRTVTDLTFLWIFGSGEASWFSNGAQNVQIIADKKTYAPGDTAHLSLISQVAPFHALVVATGYSVEFRKVISSDGMTVNFDLPITADSQPNLDVSVFFLKDGQLYQAGQQIKVPPVEQQLKVEIKRNKDIFQPEQPADYDIDVHDYKGNPVSADLSFGVVDEAIYSIYPDTSGDIVRSLYPNRYVEASVDSSLTYYFYGAAGNKSPMLAQRNTRYRPQLAQVKPGNDLVQPKIRKAFPDTAYWTANLHTDAQGHAHVRFNFPDSLTTWRATVRAVTASSQGGSAIDRVIVRKNVIVRMGTPRFLRKGDTITIPVIAHNYLDQAKQITLSLDVKGLDLLAGATKQITLASTSDGTALWRLKASSIGTADLIAKALTNEESDALELTFPVEPSGVKQTISRSGVVTGPSASTTIDFPANTDAAAHDLHITVSPSIAGSLFSALDYLTTYPWGCTEQTMSSFLPDVIVAETLNKLNLAGHIDPADLKSKVDAGFDRLADYQHDDGGWGWWKEDSSRVFMTAYVVSGLGEAAHAYKLEWPRQQMLNKGRDYLEQQLAAHPRMIPDLRAYVIDALSESGSTNLSSQLNTLWSRRSDLSSEGLALTGLAMLHANDAHTADLAKLLESKVKEQGDLASWPSHYSPVLDLEYDDSAQSTAFALRFLSHADAQSPLLPKAAEWLMLNRDNGYWWDSTEQTAMVLFGLTDYLANSQELNANFTADVRVNGANLGHRSFTPADALAGTTLDVTVPASALAAHNSIDLARTGNGRAYWSAQATYFSTERKLYQQGSLTLNLTRDYFRLTPGKDKNGNIVYNLDPLKGAAQIGDVLAVHIGISGSPEKYLFIEDPIPAGTEFIRNDDSYNIVARPNDWTWWYTRREFRDDRAVLFATDFSGHQESFYLLKVVNPGSFEISPARVQPMYQPGIESTSDELHLDVPDPSGVNP